MSDDRRKLHPKKGTGTVPKIKYRNNTSQMNQQDNYQNVSSKNLIRYSYGRECERPKFYGNSELHKKNFLKRQHYPMEQIADDNNIVPKQNGVIFTSNGSMSSPSTSTSASRRNSVGTVQKNDNVTRYPDKRQIEEKLNQIREYIQITSSLMTNMKTTDDQFYDESDGENISELLNNLKDSECKLLSTLAAIETLEWEEARQNNVSLENNKVSENGTDNYVEVNYSENPRNDLERRVVHANQEIEKLRQDNFLLNLQIKAENQMRDAIQVQQKLLHNSKDSNQVKHSKIDDELLDIQINSTLMDMLGGNNANVCKNVNGVQYDPIRDIEERLKNLNDVQATSSKPLSSNLHEHLISQVDTLQQKIGMLHDANEHGNQLIQILDNRDTQLQKEHMDLQAKLQDLHERKMQVDNLVSQLESMNEDSEEDDVGDQVRKIIGMKNHLEKLKDMLEVVKDTESILEVQNTNESDNEIQDNARAVCPKSDNLKCSKNRTQSESNISLIDPKTKDMKTNEKQINKCIINENERKRMQLQSELQAKKRELEELMCKHKAVTSNLNQDFHNDNKIDHVGLLENASNAWYPAPNVYNLPSSDRYSSDEGPDEGNSQVNSSGDVNVQPMAILNYPTSNYTKQRELDPHVDLSSEFQQVRSKTPERSIRTSAITTPVFQRETTSNISNDSINKSQMQKQLELIRSMCDSMLDQQSINSQQVRNNLTPSPIYSEPTQFTSPNSHTTNALNIVNNSIDNTGFPQFPTNTPNDMNYQNWLTTNTLQTQAFMLNTLNQCCQMLWLQQRELSSLRNSVTMMQDRFPNIQIEQPVNTVPPFVSTPPIFPSVSNVDSQQNTHCRNMNNPKTNQVSSAISMPNLNHMQVPQTNMDPAYNNLQSARLLDATLNNTVHQNTVCEHHINNSILHSVNQPLPSQIWNRQALNNQVAPGNRANNYWDNFRSYSRQNLLSHSTKSNEGLQNVSSIPDHPNNSTDRSQGSFELFPMSAPKLNINHYESGNTSVENTPRRRSIYKSQRHIPANSNSTPVPPDVLNINHLQSPSIKNVHQEILEIQAPMINEENFRADNAITPPIQPFLNIYERKQTEILSNISNDRLKSWNSRRNRNEWHEEPQTNQPVKSKLFEALRENVYKEVASLISANQGRPHFLIQLFRDLQLISSDPLRRRTLQSIQSLITQSAMNSENSPSVDRQQVSSTDQVNESVEDCLDPFQWLQSPKNSFIIVNDVSSNATEYLSDVLTFLNTHEEECLQSVLLGSLKNLLIDSTFSTIFTNIKDDTLQKHFSNLISEALEQFQDKRIKDIKMNLLQTVEELCRGEISFLRFMRESLTDTCNESNGGNEQQSLNVSFEFAVSNEGENNAPQMQNEDLAEADQSRIEVEDDEEGAVGGIFVERNSNHVKQTASDETDIVKIEFPIDAEADTEFAEQGLDQVPTRLSQSARARSTTPNRDRLNCSRSDVPEQF